MDRIVFVIAILPAVLLLLHINKKDCRGKNTGCGLFRIKQMHFAEIALVQRVKNALFRFFLFCYFNNFC